MSESINKKKFRTKKVPPENGWSYFVPFGIALPAAFSLGSMACFGLLFNDMITSFGGSTSSITIITGIYFCAYSFAGLFASSLFKKFPMRNIGIFGSVLFIIGSIMTIFATSVEHLIISFGIFEGSGIGLQIPVAYTTFNHHFVKKRVFMMSLTQTLKGFGIMLYPVISQILVETFGYRGAIAIIAAIHTHSLIGMILMHPVEWHLKEVSAEDEDSLFESKTNEEKTTISKEDEHRLKSIDEENYENLEEPLKGHSDDERKENEFKSVKYQRSKSLDPTRALDGFDPMKRRFSSIMSLGDLIGDGIIGESSVKDGKWQKVVDFLDLNLFKDFVYVNMTLGISLAWYSDSSFHTLLPMYLFEQGFSKIDTAMIVSLGAAMDLGSRITLAFISICVKIEPRLLFLFGTIGTIFFRFVFLNMNGFLGVAIIASILSILRTWLYVTVPLAYADHLSDRFASGYGLFMFLQGNLTFIIAPFIGAIRDATNSYEICFHSLAFIMSLCTIPWIIEMIYVRLHNRKKNRT